MINEFLYIQCNIMSVIILFLLITNKSSHAAKSYEQRNFNFLIATTILVLIADSMMWILNKKDFFLARELNVFFSSLCFGLTPFIGLLCVIYADSKIHGDTPKDAFKRLLPFHLMMIPCFIILVLNLFPNMDLLFTISENNEYSRGAYFWIFTVIPYVFMLYSSITALIASRKAVSSNVKREFKYVSGFILFPIIGALFQTITGLSFTWNFVTIAILILFIKIQNQQVTTDPLTGLFNRRRLETYVARQILLSDADDMYSLMIDIDDFKKINDTYGHSEGDCALIAAATILSASAKKGDFSARYGGDEFVLICHRSSKYDIYGELFDNIEANVTKYNASSEKPYQISFSIGCSHFDKTVDTGSDSFISRADKEMYTAKMMKKCGKT